MMFELGEFLVQGFITAIIITAFMYILYEYPEKLFKALVTTVAICLVVGYIFKI